MKTRRPYPPGHSARERNPRARLSGADALSIREAYARGGGAANGGISHRELGLQYGVSRSAIGLIVAGQRWKITHI